MPKTVTLRDANQTFARLVRQVEGGAEFVVTRRGKPVAKIVPVAAKRVLTPEQEAARERSRRRLLRGWPIHFTGFDRDALHER